MIKQFLSRAFSRFKVVNAPAQRSYSFGAINRLTADWVYGGSDANKELKGDLKTMRERSRQLERDDDYVRRFLKLLENNVLGASGIGLQMKVREPSRNGIGLQYDTRANSTIENSWARWGRRENCSLNGRYSWLDIQRLVLRSTARDGAILVRKHFTGPFGFQLEPIEIDLLDIGYQGPVYNGNEIHLGIETSPSGAIVTYHMFTRHPGDTPQTIVTTQRTQVPAAVIYHVFKPERVGQVTGAPWIHSGASGLKNLNGYIEAEIIASRAAAAKMAFLERQNSTEYTGTTDSIGNRQMEISPGTIEELPPGFTVKPFDPTHPNNNFGAFVKSALRGIAAGLGVSYVSLANDLEGVNYSSIRAGLLDEREEWKSLQNWFIEWFIQPVFVEWLESALALGAVSDGTLVLPASKFDKFNAPEFKPRRWDWVDPLKDMQASVLSVEKGFKSRRSIIAEAGGDIEDTFAEIAADEDLEEAHGLDFSEEQKPESAEIGVDDKE